MRGLQNKTCDELIAMPTNRMISLERRAMEIEPAHGAQLAAAAAAPVAAPPANPAPAAEPSLAQQLANLLQQMNGNNPGNQPNAAQTQVGTEARPGAEGPGLPAGWRIPTVPAPQKFSGDDGYDLYTAIFHFENYLRGNRVPRDMWPAYAQSLLTGTAAKQYAAHAQSLARQPTWEDFRAALKIFENPQQARQAMLELMDLVQTKSVRDYIQKFNLLRVKSGTKAGEEHLILLFHKGLKDKESVALNPANGKWWDSLQDLMDYVLSKETTLNTQPKGGNEGSLRVAGGVRKKFGFKRAAHPAAKLKAAFVRTQGGGNNRGLQRKATTARGNNTCGGAQGATQDSADDYCGICYAVEGKFKMHKGADSRDCRNYAKWKAAKPSKPAN